LPLHEEKKGRRGEGLEMSRRFVVEASYPSLSPLASTAMEEELESRVRKVIRTGLEIEPARLSVH